MTVVYFSFYSWYETKSIWSFICCWLNETALFNPATTIILYSSLILKNSILSLHLLIHQLIWYNIILVPCREIAYGLLIRYKFYNKAQGQACPHNVCLQWLGIEMEWKSCLRTVATRSFHNNHLEKEKSLKSGQLALTDTFVQINSVRFREHLL